MEFGVFIHGYVPRERIDTEDDAEHNALLEDVALVVAAEAAGFKYAWVAEHHFLHEYSHLSASDTVLGYLAHATERIHLGAGTFNPLPKLSHPAKLAERAAMLDHLSDGRFELGTGPVAGSFEAAPFVDKGDDGARTEAVCRTVLGEIRKMWVDQVYEGFRSGDWSLPARTVLPKPWRRPHPPLWYAARDGAGFAAAARMGLGALGLGVGSVLDIAPAIDDYKCRIGNAEPVGAYVNDNVMVTTPAYVAEDGWRARDLAVGSGLGYLQSNVFRYHDSVDRPRYVPPWPALLPEPTLDDIDPMAGSGMMICGDPYEALEQIQRWESAGVDQLVLHLAASAFADAAETVRLFGEYVIPKLDADPVHRTTRFRDASGGQ